MIPKKIEVLINAIIEKTNSKKATWGKTSRTKEFKLHFEKGAITTDVWEDDGNEYVDFAIYNSFGDQVERYVFSKDEENYKVLIELHKAANREFYKVDETITNLFNEVKADKNIGKREVDSGDLPF